MMNRRDFVKVSVSSAASVSASVFQGRAAAVPWFDRPMRWAQVAFVEDDPGNFGLEFWLDYFRKLHVDAACLSAGGCVAFYPMSVPFHYRSKFLGNTDPFGDFVKGCRSLGMNVVGRTDPHAAHQDVCDAPGLDHG